MENRQWYCFTFGTNHRIGGRSMMNSWVEIFGTHGEAREIMFSRYGDKWSMQYLKGELNEDYFPAGCYEKINNFEDPDSHSCYGNSVASNDGNDYCTVCGKMTKSLEIKELEADIRDFIDEDTDLSRHLCQIMCPQR